MGANDLVSKEIQRIVSTVIYIACAVFGLLVLAVWTVILLNLTKAIAWPIPLTVSAALLIFGVSVALSCALIWFLNRISILKLSAATEKAIWRVLIVSVLGTAATAIAKAFK